MRVLCVIPARLGSTRLPDKPLQALDNRPLIRVVAERALEFGLFDRIVVATDHPRVADAVSQLPVEAVVTDGSFRCGTERVAAVARLDRYRRAETVVNLQGDEPFVPREALAGALRLVSGGEELATAAARLAPADLDRPSATKVLVRDGAAVRFTRSGGGPDAEGGVWFRHLGLYAYRPAALAGWAAASPVPDEIETGLEQLRPMARGKRIGVWTLDGEAPPGVDTPEDLMTARRDFDRFQTRTQVTA